MFKELNKQSGTETVGANNVLPNVVHHMLWTFGASMYTKTVVCYAMYDMYKLNSASMNHFCVGLVL